jgi:outer membrane protein assembly factor BamD
MAYPSPLTRKLMLFVCGLCLVASLARADLVWSPGTGWQVESGALSGLSAKDGRTALDMMNRARQAEENGQNRKALSLYAKVARKFTSSIYAPEALYRVGKLRLARKQYYDAFDAFQNIATAYPNVRRFDEIIGLQYRIAGDLLDGARNHVLGVVPFFRNKERAIKDMEIVVLEAPYGDYAALALTEAARGREQSGDTEEAIDILDRVINNYSQSVLVPDAYIQLARLHSSLVEGPYYDQDETKQAMTYYEDFMILFPGDSSIGSAATGLDAMRNMLAESKMKIGDFYFYKRDNYTAARVFYNEAITSYPDSNIAKRARSRLAEVDAKAARAAQPPPVKSPSKKKFWLF